jgi:plastocyanin
MQSRPIFRAALAAAVALGLLPAVASADATVSIPPNNVVFQPDSVTIQAGQKVNWDFSQANLGHNIVFLAPGADFPANGTGLPGPEFTFNVGGAATFQKQFSTAGTFRYVCSLHYFNTSGMRGTVTVQPADQPPPPPPPATLPPEPIALASDLATPFSTELFTLTGTEVNPKRLTQADGEDFEPAWSYDAAHRQLAFQSGRNGRFEIFTSDADGSNQVDLTPGNTSNNIEPSWSPDSSKIAFASDRTGGGDIYVMDFDGSHVRQLTSGQAVDRHPTWSPDGKHIAFERTPAGGTSAISIMDIDPDGTGEGTNVRAMVPGLVQRQVTPEWSPLAANKVALVILRGSGPDPDTAVFDLSTEQTTFLTGDFHNDEDPTWSPDGTRVLWTRDFAGADKDLMVRKADGLDGRFDGEAVTSSSDGRGYLTPAWQPAPKPAKPRPAQPTPTPTPAPTGDSGAPPPAGDTGTRPDPGTGPDPGAFLGIDQPRGTRIKAFRRLGLAVTARCVGVDAGRVKIAVSAKLARRLGLTRTPLAAAPARCGADKKATALLKPGAKVRRALVSARARRALKGGLKTTLSIAMSGGGKTLSAKLAVLIRS